MDRVKCEIENVELEGDTAMVPGVQAICSKCDHETEAFGRTPASVRRCLVKLREECPRNEENFYVASDGSDKDEEKR